MLASSAPCLLVGKGRANQGEQVVKSRRRAVRSCGCQDCQKHPGGEIAKEHEALNRIVALLDEKRRRLVVGCLAEQWGCGGVTRLAQITGMSRNTIRRGQQDLEQGGAESRAPSRRAGGGRKRVEKKRPG